MKKTATASLMLQGVGSDVGKSLLVAGLCRAYTKRGLKVLPFKPQNMSNNAAVTADGGEIGRAQWLQALACGAEPVIHMNPVLLKPEADNRSQVIVQGRVRTATDAADYQQFRQTLKPAVMESYRILCADADLVLTEGAGSPAEINLRAHDIANMGFARAAGCPVVLVGDIDRGGVIASVVGTQLVLDPADASVIAGYIINKFRGDLRLFDGGIIEINKRIGKPCFGVVPYMHALKNLPQEDAMTLPETTEKGAIKIVSFVFPHIANFDDFDPLIQEPNVRFCWLKAGDVLPADTDIVILPGTKTTVSDLTFLRMQGWDIDIKAHMRRGGRVIGICGGYQMLGKMIFDPEGVESAATSVPGLGLLDVETVFSPQKTVTPWQGICKKTNAVISAYEIHVGHTAGADTANAPFQNSAGAEGATSANGQITGTYLHGLFANDEYRKAFLNTHKIMDYKNRIEMILDDWAKLLENSLDLNALLNLAKTKQAVTP